jgi:hypothetical protein
MDNYAPVQNMTASSTQYCKRLDPAWAGYVFLLFLAIFSMAWAASSSLSIKSAELESSENAYALNADFEVNFSKEVEEALNKGVQLDFLVEFQIVTPSSWWFDDEIKTDSTHITLGYHALSRQYLVNRANHQYAFATLREAKEEISHIRNWKVVDKSLLKKDEKYQAALRMRLDQSRLPKPLQVDALGSEDWNMVSERYRWTPAFAF